MANPNFDAIVATTLKNYLPKLEDNVFSARPLVFFLKQAGQIRTISGGTNIVLPLIYAQNTTAGSFSGYDVIPTTPQDGISAAEYGWKQYAVSVAISGREERMNNSDEEVIDLLEAKVMQAEETVLEQLDQQFFLDGTGNGGKDFLGLDRLVAQNTTVVGGIDPVANAYWQSNLTAVGGVLTLAQMETSYNNATVGNDRPNVILTTQLLYEKYNNLLQNNQRFVDTSTADAGFENLAFHTAPVTYDTYCQATRMYMLNSKYLRLVGHADCWFKPTPFQRPPDQDARYMQILLQGELTISNRKRHSVLTGATP